MKAQASGGAQSHSFEGTWILNVNETSAGTAPDEQLTAWSMTFKKATKERVTWDTDLSVRGMQKPLHFGWDGVPDGKPHPLVGIPGSEAYHWEGSTLIREADHGHGETKYDTTVLSADGNTMIVTDTTTTPEGKTEAHQILHRKR